MKDNELKNCPFCGKQPEVTDGMDGDVVRCINPDCVAGLENAYYDIPDWNTRPAIADEKVKAFVENWTVALNVTDNIRIDDIPPAEKGLRKALSIIESQQLKLEGMEKECKDKDKAIGFARSMILGGESMTDTAEAFLTSALATNTKPKEQT